MTRAIFFDIDGTLISFKTHTIPQPTIDAINQLKQKGVKVFIATGRSFSDIGDLCGLEFDGYITANGAYCITPDNQVIFENLIDQENLNALAEYIKDKPFACAMMTDKGNFANYIDDSAMVLYDLVDIAIPKVEPIEETIKKKVFQIDAFITKEDEADLLSKALTKCEATRWHPAFADINVINNNKSTGIDKFIEHFGIDISETMALGDGGNDIAMLKHVAVGIAMGNANDNVKDIADYITDSVDDNGVVNALKHFGVL